MAESCVSAKLVWGAPDIDGLIAYVARVSNPANQGNSDTAPRLIRYLIRNRHWSPFELANVCMEFEAPRDISRQVLRHGKALGIQEFSYRYADASNLPSVPLREARMQDAKNRQASHQTDDEELKTWWESQQSILRCETTAVYWEAIERGIAKEQARVVLMEGLTPSRLYLNGTVRAWLHYCDLRRGNGTQAEHAELADLAWGILKGVAPATCEAFENTQSETN